MKPLANYVFAHRFFPCTLSLYTASDPWEVVEGTEKGRAVIICLWSMHGTLILGPTTWSDLRLHPWCANSHCYTYVRGQKITAPLMLQLFSPRTWRYFYLGELLPSFPVFGTSSFPSCPLSVILHPPPRLQGGPIYHWPKEGLHFVCFGASPSISCSPNERGYSVPAGPGRFKGPRSPVSETTWGSNYPSAGALRDAPPAGQSNSHTLDSYSWACGPASIIREAPEPRCRVTQDEGDATGSTQRALALVAGIGESMGCSVPNSAEERRKWGDGRGGALTGRGMNCQREINNEGKVGSRWPAAGLPRRDRDRLTSRLALTRGLPLVTDPHAVPLKAGWRCGCPAYLPQTTDPFYSWNCSLLEFMSKIENRINCLAFTLTLPGLDYCKQTDLYVDFDTFAGFSIMICRIIFMLHIIILLLGNPHLRSIIMN